VPVTWFKVDDSFHAHPKVLATDADALGLWVVAGSWSGANLTDGFVPDHVLTRLLPDAVNLARKLITAGLWRKARGGYRFHDWGEFNPKREDVEAERKAARERMRKLRNGRKDAGQSANGSPEQQANVRAKFATPTRPDPVVPSELQDPPVVPPEPKAPARASGSARRGTRLPDDFAVTAEMVEWARRETPDVDGRYETAKFVDYWGSKSGQSATKTDWVKTWRNWMRKAQERAGPAAPRTAAARRPTIDDKVSGFVERGRRLQAMQDNGELDIKELTA
jgi:hypothetical protein